MRDSVTLPPRVDVQSGLGEKGPACLRVWTGRETWILDVGAGPEATSPFVPDWLEGADRVFITHDHIDHIGGAAHAIAAGQPIHCTAQTARALPPGAKLGLLAERGEACIGGVTVTTGRNGHALGGVWLHLGIGQGLFYSGDWSEESRWFAFDAPPPARVAMIDASYHLDDVAQADRRARLDATLAGARGRQLLFPVPPSGRAGELALHLMGWGEVSLDDACKQAIATALASGGLAPGCEALARLLDQPFDPAARFLVCDTPNADGGEAWRMVRAWRDAGRLGGDAAVVFTGHMTAHARAIAAEGGHFLRWNVHPPLSDQIRMLDRLDAHAYAPLFCSNPEDYLLESRIPARLLLNEGAVL
ncbi:MBL fold metallo-hydrolase [Salipiger mangrovisoli]|uniref:MBL fold metallo-hydrolase n=1 Tax=Salipiger mangrovisoli TaxID=2865933 RepID=A0ABR9X840_9RHOB|nr:MBL fold metallo-hydrolase [Salipiger mangrovisoli]MBE9639661.1 MBL fold metallo-hydrolase [Salipiger mangrovisoli]